MRPESRFSCRSSRQARVPDVVIDVEVLVVDPGRMPVDRQLRQDLAVARDTMEARLHVGADALDVDAAVGRAERTGLVHRGSCDVHVVGRALGDQERVVEEQWLHRFGTPCW